MLTDFTTVPVILDTTLRIVVMIAQLFSGMPATCGWIEADARDPGHDLPGLPHAFGEGSCLWQMPFRCTPCLGFSESHLVLPLVSREGKNGSNSSYNCTPFLHSLLTKR